MAKELIRFQCKGQKKNGDRCNQTLGMILPNKTLEIKTNSRNFRERVYLEKGAVFCETCGTVHVYDKNKEEN